MFWQVHHKPPKPLRVWQFLHSYRTFLQLDGFTKL
ncbi:MAG: hypothetical protein D6712_04495 [Chloroflexi bacterium]|nr:MAG: hypothetical protein D6712_04495 [Chloroflexota bacterium]